MKKDGKINILFLIDTFYYPGAGTENHLYYLASRLNKDRFNPIVCYFEGNSLLAELLQKEGITAVNIPLSRIYSPKAFVQAFKLAKLIKKNKIDIVQTYHFKSDTYGVFVSRLSGVPKIISSRRDTGDLKKTRHTLLNKIMNQFINHYIMVCEAVGKTFKESEGIPQKKMTTIYNGVDLKRFSTNGDQRLDDLKREIDIEKGTFVVGTSAMFRPEKGYDVLLEGIKKANPYIGNWKVLLMGHWWDGITYEYCKEYCDKNGLNHIIRFMGYKNEIEKYLQIMDVFCLVPKRNEGFSNAILEAMAMGKPVIATDVGGNAEAVIHNETGIIIPPDDSDSLAEAILKLYRDPELRLEMGKKGRKRVEQEFPMEKMIKEHERLYEEIFSNKKS